MHIAKPKTAIDPLPARGNAQVSHSRAVALYQYVAGTLV
jgi:hypothetical protein